MQAQRVGSRYLLADRLGSGAMGDVHLARLADGDEQVAVKLLRPELAEDPDLIERFFLEARLLRSIAHPNVVRVLDLVAEGDRLAIVMAYVPGGDLRQAVPASGSIEVIRDLLGQVADGLAAIHTAGIVHRDLKPENVLVERGTDGTMRAQVTDFGLSHRWGSRSTEHRGPIGTAGYLSPECAKGLPVGPESDVYALGVMLYEMIAGVPPFVADDHLTLIRAHRDSAVPRPAAMADPWWELVSRMLSKDPCDRPGAAAVADELRKLPGGSLPAGVRAARSSGLSDDETATLLRKPADSAAGSGRGAATLLRPPAVSVRPAIGRRWPRVPLAALAAAVFAALVAVAGLHLSSRRQAVPVAPVATTTPVATATPKAPVTVSPAARNPSASATTGSYPPPSKAAEIHAPQAPALVVDPGADSLLASDSQASFRIDDVVAGSGKVAKIVIIYDDGSQQVKLIAGYAGPYRATVPGLVNGVRYTFSARVCNSFGKCADSTPVTFEPFGLPTLNALAVEVSGLHRSLTVPPVTLNGNPRPWTCSVTAQTTLTDRNAPTNQAVSTDGGTFTWLPFLLHDYTAQETCTNGTTSIEGPVLSFET